MICCNLAYGPCISYTSRIATRHAGWSQYLIITVFTRIELCTPPIARVDRSDFNLDHMTPDGAFNGQSESGREIQPSDGLEKAIS